MFKLDITNIYCHSKGGDASHDDMMILVQVDAGPPNRFPLFSSHPMNDDDKRSWDPGAVYYFEHSAYISIWDRDGALNFCDASDMLGAYYVTPNTVNSYSANLRGDQGASYTITYTVTDAQPAEYDNGTSLDSDFMQAIDDDLTAWFEDNQGIVSITDPSDLEGLLKAALLSTAFKKVADKIQSEEKVKAVSLGLMTGVDIFGGIAGAFGVALNRSAFQFVGVDSDPDSVTSSIFAGGGFSEGEEVGIYGTLAIGIWFEDAEDIGGFYIGDELDVDDGLGITTAVFAGKDDEEDFKDENGNILMEKAKVIFAGIDVGVAEGDKADELYFFSGTMSPMPVSQSGDYDHMAVLSKLSCHDALSADNATDAKDHVYLTYTVDDDTTEYRYPIWNTIEMNEGDLNSWLCGNAILFNEKFTVTLYVGTSSAKDSQLPVDSQVYTYNDLVAANSDYDPSFKGNEGVHEIDYHLHALLQY